MPSFYRLQTTALLYNNRITFFVKKIVNPNVKKEEGGEGGIEEILWLKKGGCSVFTAEELCTHTCTYTQKHSLSSVIPISSCGSD